jgi:hypothetical protein
LLPLPEAAMHAPSEHPSTVNDQRVLSFMVAPVKRKLCDGFSLFFTTARKEFSDNTRSSPSWQRRPLLRS